MRYIAGSWPNERLAVIGYRTEMSQRSVKAGLWLVFALVRQKTAKRGVHRVKLAAANTEVELIHGD
jgi:hypothetical protein